VSDPNGAEEIPPDEEPPADEEYARAYAAGYEDGLRSALREVVQYAARGHTPQEIRMLAEGRLVRLAEEVDTKRRSLLAPPRRTAWTALLKAPPPGPFRPWTAPVAGAPVLIRVPPGQSVLVREEQPSRALELLRASAPAFPRVVVVSLRPPELPGISPDRRTEISPRGPPGPEGAPTSVGLSELGGRLRDPTEAPGGALVYLDAIEYYVTQEGLEMVIRFAHWLSGQARESRSAVVVSYDRRTLDAKEGSRLERAFGLVL
jgi:hypothetical protein